MITLSDTTYIKYIYTVCYLEYLLIILYSNGSVLRMFSVLLFHKRRQHTVTLDQHSLSCTKEDTDDFHHDRVAGAARDSSPCAASELATKSQQMSDGL